MKEPDLKAIAKEYADLLEKYEREVARIEAALALGLAPRRNLYRCIPCSIEWTIDIIGDYVSACPHCGGGCEPVDSVELVMKEEE